MSYNLTYRTQLWEDLKCSEITILDINNIDYKLKELHKLFLKYNYCVGSEFTDYNFKKKRDAFNLSIKPGIRYSSLSLENSLSDLHVDFENDLKFSFGIEVEYILPFNKNKWSVTFEPTYQSFKSKDTHPVYSFEASYNSFEFPIGIKYGLFLNEHNKIFLTGSLVLLDLPFDSYIGSLEINTLMNLNFGLGYNYHNKYSVEFRYATKREMINGYLFYSGGYQSISFILGYTLF